MRNSIKINLVFAIILILGGGVCAFVDQSWNYVSMFLVGLGCVIVIFSLLRHWPLINKRLLSADLRKTGIILLAGTLASLCFIGINYYAAKLPFRFDVTVSKQHTLVPGTIKLIETLKAEVQLTAFQVGAPPLYLEDLFKEYARTSKTLITTEIIDPIEQIGYAAKFGNIIDGKQSKLVVQSGNARHDVDFTKSPLTEDQINNAIIKVTRKERKACFTTGHGEYSLSATTNQGLTTWARMLKDNNILAKEVMLGTQSGVPNDCDVLVVAGAQNELTIKENKMIEAYLNQGGDALFLIENIEITTPDKPLTEVQMHKNSSFNSILNLWGINIGEDVVVDLSNHAGDDVGSPATKNYEKHKAITEGLDYTFFVRPRSISIMPKRRSSIKFAPIVSTMKGSKSWAETNRNLQLHYDPLVDIPGPVPLAYVLMEDKNGKMTSDTRIIVFTDADFLSNIFIDQYSNANLGLNVLNWLTESDQISFVNHKEIVVSKLDLTSRQKRIVAALLFLMPVCITLAGIIVWMKR